MGTTHSTPHRGETRHNVWAHPYFLLDLSPFITAPDFVLLSTLSTPQDAPGRPLDGPRMRYQPCHATTPQGRYRAHHRACIDGPLLSAGGCSTLDNHLCLCSNGNQCSTKQDTGQPLGVCKMSSGIPRDWAGCDAQPDVSRGRHPLTPQGPRTMFKAALTFTTCAAAGLASLLALGLLCDNHPVAAGQMGVIAAALWAPVCLGKLD
jgi:hypothetical protein